MENYELHLERMIIRRNNTPSNSDTDGKINVITREEVGILKRPYIPRVGEVINFLDTNYTVVAVVYPHPTIYEDCNAIVLQVTPYNTTRLRTQGSDAFNEEIPVITDVKLTEAEYQYKGVFKDE